MNQLTVGQLIEILSEYDKDTYIEIDAVMEFKNGNTVYGYSNDLSLEESFYVDDEFVDDGSNTLYFQVNVKAIEGE